MGTINSRRVDYSSFGLQDKIAIVTGASQGIGRAIALGLAQAGAHLVLAKYPDKQQDAIKTVQAEIEALGRKALIVQTDVAQVQQVRAMVDQAHATFGRVDILVNNAGWTGTTPALDVSEEEYDRTMAASLKSVFFASQAVARVMIPQGGAESSTSDPTSERSPSKGGLSMPQPRRACTTYRAPFLWSGLKTACW